MATYSECIKKIAEDLRNDAINESDLSRKNALNRSAVSKVYYACMHWCAEIITNVTNKQVDFRKHKEGTNWKIRTWIQFIPTTNYPNQTNVYRDYEWLRRKRNIADYKDIILSEKFILDAFDIANRIVKYLDANYVKTNSSELAIEARNTERKTKRPKPQNPTI